MVAICYLGSMCLRTVLNHLQPMLASNLHNRSHVGRLSIQVHRNNRLQLPPSLFPPPFSIFHSPFSDFRFQIPHVQVVGPGVGIYQADGGPHVSDGLAGGNVGVGDGDHLVALADAKGFQRQAQGIGVGANADGMFHTDVIGESLLKGFHLLAQDEGGAFQHALDGSAIWGLREAYWAFRSTKGTFISAPVSKVWRR